MTITPNQIRQLADALEGLPALLTRFGKDGKEVEAFYEDFKDAIDALKDDPKNYQILMKIPISLGAEALRGVRDFKIWRPSTHDVTKSMRRKAEEFAKILNFKRYKALRNIP